MTDTFQKTEFYWNLLENAETYSHTTDAASVEILPIYTIFIKNFGKTASELILANIVSFSFSRENARLPKSMLYLVQLLSIISYQY